MNFISRAFPHYPILPLLVLFSLSSPTPAPAADWRIPLAGNAYRIAPSPGGDRSRPGPGLSWSSAEDVYSVFFRLSRPARLEVGIDAKPSDGASELEARVGGHSFHVTLDGADSRHWKLGAFEVPTTGYVRVDLRGLRRDGPTYGELRDLVVRSEGENLAVDFVRSNEGNMFYWGRRGPSVHLTYQVPTQSTLRFAYSEILVPDGQDPIGSYFMANGFAEGYFGIQVNSAQERRVLFSVWSPFQTDNPKEIPEDQRIQVLGKGPDVRTGEFGNEGSGGQSFLVYPWKAGTTYRFLTEVRPDGQGQTVYTAWFGDKAANEWRLIASFRRPKTNTHLRGFHSFLESFQPSTGHIERRGRHLNVWVCDTSLSWHEVLQARFSVDPTGNGRHRLDYAGGVDGDGFYLRNCGFFNATVKPGDVFTRPSTTSQKPDIDFDKLPRG